MSTPPLRVSPSTAAVLREAHHKIHAVGADHYAVYDQVRAALAKITHLDAFYVGLLHGTRKVRFPYGFEGMHFDDPQVHSFGPRGQTAWLVAHRQTYRFAYDNGAVLNTGVSFGDVRRCSADAVTVPLLRADGANTVFGMISLHSYRPNTYTDECVRAAEWLAADLARLLTRQEEDRTLLGEVDPDGTDGQPLVLEHVVEYLANQVGEIRREIAAAEADPANAAGRLCVAQQRCAKVQTELIDMTAATDRGPEHRFGHLTPAEQAVAVLLTSELSNAELARELGVSGNTVKTHVQSILRKYGMTSRTRAAADVRRHLS